jgi:ABC-type glycerol-3-phosphate transport system permease component
MTEVSTTASRRWQPFAAMPLLSRTGREVLTGYLLLLPAALLVLGLIAYPTIYTVWLSLTHATGFSGPGEFAGLANYRTLIADAEFWTGVRNALVVGGIIVLLEVPLGVATALLLWWRFWGRAIVFVAVFIPWVYPAAFSGFAWYWMFTPPFHTFYTAGVVNLRAAVESVLGPGWWAFISIIVLNVWRGSSFIAIFLLAALNSIPTEILEYARLETKSAWSRFRYVIAPLVWPWLVLAVIVSLVITYIDFTNVYIQSAGRVYEPLPLTQSYTLSIRHGFTGLGAATVAIQFPLIAALLAAAFYLIDRAPAFGWGSDTSPTAEILEKDDSTRTGSVASAPGRFSAPPALLNRPEETVPAVSSPSPIVREGSAERARRLRHVLLVIAGGLAAFGVAAFHIFPIYWTVIQAVRPIVEDLGGNPFWVHDPSLDAYFSILSNEHFWEWMRNTAIIFGGALLLTLVTSLMAGYALARFHIPGGRGIAWLMLASYFIPQTAVIIPIYQLLLALNIEDTMLSVILLYQTLAIPFCTWLFYIYFRGLPPDIEESALLDGSRFAVFRHVLLRLSWPVIVAAGVFAVGVMASDLLYASTFLIHHGQQTVVQGLGVIEIDLDEWNNITGGIGLGALPIVLACAAFAPSYVRGLTAAMVEGS